MKIKLYILIFISLFSVFEVSGQRFKAFSNNQDTYIEELTDFYRSDVNMKKDKQKQFEQLLVEYASIWNAMPVQQKKDVMQLSNEMLQKRIRPSTGFYDFIETQVAFYKTKQSPESFNQWFKGLQWTIKSSTLNGFNNAVSSSLNLVKNNLLYSTSLISWSVKHNGYSIRIDEQRGPYVDFTSEIDLTYSSKKDENTIYSTRGRFYIVEQVFEGEKGRVNWERVGLNKDDVYVELSKYNVSLKRASIFADSVLFTNKEYFSHKLQGSFEDQCSDKVIQSSFPRFYSYKREEIIKNIFENVDYVGGFTQQGGKFLGSGDEKEPAELVFSKEGKVFCRAKALVHPFSQEGIASLNCQVTFYINNDSIYHPGLLMRYNKSTREIACINNKEGISASPWVDSYHAIDIYTEAVYTKLDDHTIEFTSIKGPSNSVSFASFESNNYYTQSKWDKIQGIDETNPIYRVKAYADKYKTRQIRVKDFAKFISMDQTQAEVLLIRLAINGFINYESYRKTAIVKDKIYDYIKAYTKKQDYDNIRFVSSTKKEPNAVLNIFDMDLRMNGIETFSLSDTHFVNIAPIKGQIVMKKNRSFSFDGKVSAGRFNLGGENCYFDYEKFALKLPKVDSLAFFVPLFEDTNTITKIKTPLCDLVCEILIDDPNNKSSIKRIQGYPMLSSLQESYVYYDQTKIQNGSYLRDKFYYKLEPFKIKDLMTFKVDSVQFTGVLYSGGIFADIKEPLVVMKDYSLGFIIQTPQKGMAAYGGKGQYYNRIDLSLQGLLGAGYLEYLASRTDSRMFVFLLDSMYSENDKFLCENSRNTLFPEVSVGKSFEKWYPYLDSMIVEQRAEPFAMYKAEAFHSGALALSPKGLIGWGENNSNQMKVSSSLFKFSPLSYSCDTSSFTLKTLDGENIAFVANYVSSRVDVPDQGKFRTLEGLRLCDIPYMQYNCQIDEITWKNKEKQLELQKVDSTNNDAIFSKGIRELVDLDIAGAKFTSTNPLQKNLSFKALLPSNLDLTTNTLTVGGVPLIKSADVAIKPPLNSVKIHPGAQMDTIDNAELLMNVTNKLHLFSPARVAIFSSELYSANGYINYIDEENKKHSIFMSNISPNPISSQAKGEILRENALELNSAFNFYGSVQINAKDTNYFFDGGVQLRHNCNEELAWIKFNSQIDPKNIVIPISEAPLSMDNQRITASLQYNKRNMEPYSAFLTLDKDTDNTFMRQKGYLVFDKTKNRYVIASKEKIENFNEGKGNYMTMDKTSCQTKAEGAIDIGFNKKGGVIVDNYGTIDINNKKISADINMSFGLRFPFNQKALDYMGVELYEDMNLSPIEFETSKYKDQLIDKFKDRGEELYEDLAAVGEWETIPKGMDYTLYFSNVSLQWDNVLNSYVSYGDAELSIVGKYQVNKKVRAKIQLLRTSISNEIKIYIEANPDHWYFFYYNGVSMSVSSSSEIFNDYIKETPNKEREFKTEDKKIFTYRLALPNEKREFIRKLEKIEDIQEEE